MVNACGKIQLQLRPRLRLRLQINFAQSSKLVSPATNFSSITSAKLAGTSGLFVFWFGCEFMEEKLIELVRDQEILWNIKSKAYRNVHVKEKVWKKISESLNITAERAQKRWRSLRDKYRMKKNKKKAASGSEATYDTVWRFYDHLKFLDSSLEPRKTHTAERNISQAIPEIVVAEPENFFDDIIEECLPDDIAQPSYHDIDDSSASLSYLPSYTPTKSGPKKGKAAAQKNILEKAGSEFSELVATVKDIMKPRSSINLFFNSLSLQIEEVNLSKVQWMGLQQELLTNTMRVIGEAQRNNNNY